MPLDVGCHIVTLERGCSTQGYPTVCTVLPCFTTLTFLPSTKWRNRVEGETSSHWIGPKIRVFPEFSSRKNSLLPGFCWSPCNRKNASNFIISFLFISFQWWALVLSFWLGVFSKNFWTYQFVFWLLLSHFLVYKTTQNIKGGYWTNQFYTSASCCMTFQTIYVCFLCL
jgi:hypothetical protein